MLIALKSKIYNLIVTDSDVNCNGSITIDSEVLKKAGIKKYEQVHVLDLTNGERLVTYALKGAPGEVKINGAAAKKVGVGDKIMVLAYQLLDTGIVINPKIVNFTDT